MIAYSTQHIDQSDIKAVCEAMQNPILTGGEGVVRFEEELKALTNCDYAIATSSATAALHLSMIALDIKEDDIVYVPAISFVASANCALYQRAKIEFIDVNEDALIDIDDLSLKLKSAKEHGKLPKAVICVHMSGRSCDMKALYKLSKIYNFYIIEDAAHALGASYDFCPVGSCKYSDLAIFSFHPVKIITTLEGGSIHTNNQKLALRLKKLRSHGIEHDCNNFKRKNMPKFYYEMQELGYNYRLSDVQAALGCNQIEKIQALLEKRKECVSFYKENLDTKNLQLPRDDSADNISSWHLYQIKVGNNHRDELYKELRKRNIGVQVHYLPIYAHPFYQQLYPNFHLVGAENFFKATLTLPCHAKLSTLDLQLISSSVNSILDRLNK